MIIIVLKTRLYLVANWYSLLFYNFWIWCYIYMHIQMPVTSYFWSTKWRFKTSISILFWYLLQYFTESSFIQKEILRRVVYYNINTLEWFESVGYTQSEPFVHILLFIILEGGAGLNFYVSFLLFLFFGIRTERS